jgi:hypothetical protein
MENYIEKLRQKTTFYLLDRQAEFVNDNSNPFSNNGVPLMADFLNSEPTHAQEAYESGNRSILFKHKGKWCKAKGIGIPVGISRPVFEKNSIYTYLLYDDPGMCHKSILWGFMQEEEYSCEVFGSKRAMELGQDIELIGATHWDSVFLTQYKDRFELFNSLKQMEKRKIRARLMKSKEKTMGYSSYYYVPSDIRVGEIFFTIMFPEIPRLIDETNIREYVQWLGNSCGRILRRYHDSGAIHGTWVGPKQTSLGLLDIHSNSYTGNYIVDEEKITMCDFDLAKPIEKDSEKELEKWALVHVENPLYYAGSYSPNDALSHGMAERNPFREEISQLFEKSVDEGYNKEEFSLERKKRRNLLQLFVKAKSKLWELYDLPKTISGQIDFVDYIIATKKVDSKRLKELIRTF